MSPLIYTVDANAFELFSRADGRLRALDRMLTPAEVVLAEKVRIEMRFQHARPQSDIFLMRLKVVEQDDATRGLVTTHRLLFFLSRVRRYLVICCICFFMQGEALREKVMRCI